MARGQSPYQGRYTVPIADFSGIERAGAAWGDAFKGIGEQVEKYQLNKKKRTVLEDSLQGKIEALMEHDPRAAEALFRDESFDKDTQRLATGEMKLSELEGLVGKIDGYSGQTQNIMRDKLAASQARIALVDAGIAERDKAQMSQFAKTLAELQVERVTDTNQAEIDRLNALAESVGLDRDILKRTVDDRVSILRSQAKTAEAGAKKSALELWNAERAKNVTQWQDRLRGGPLGSANYLNDIQDMQLDLLKGKITEQNIANTLANAPRSIRSILEEQNKFTESIKKTSVSWKGKMIPFSDYMGLHFANDEDENLYPLKGEGAANTPQGRLWAQYTTSVLDTNERLGEAEAIFDTGEGTGEGESPDIGISKQDTKETALEKTHYAIQDLEEQIQEAERKITDRTLPIAETEAAQDVVKELRKKLRLLEQSSYAPNAHEKALIKFKEQRESPSEYKKRVQGVRN
tara:strand:- start:58 stop:1443 length:1386 start_codon:yes stop_codon:yes gene_type:complete